MDLFPQQINRQINEGTTHRSPNEAFEEQPNDEARKFHKLLDDLN